MNPRRLFFLISILLALLLFGCSGSGSNNATQPVSNGDAPAGSATSSNLPSTGDLTPTSALPAASSTAAPQPSSTSGSTAAPSATAPAAQAPQAVEFPSPDSIQLKEIASGLTIPVGLANAGDGSGRLFVIEQGGLIRIVQDGQVLEPPFLDLSRSTVGRGERGLLGLAFHPRYAENGFFFVNYTDLNGDSVISRFQVSASDPNQVDPESEQRLLLVEQPFPNHNGGGMVFGPDGYLYISLGDGGSAGDPEGNAQSLDTLLGKILRIDVDGGQPYAIPPDNPFASQSGAQPEIWAYGLRNPWRFSFDRATGDMYIADVGQNVYEEVNFIPTGTPPGGNFGWDYLEASHPFEGSPPSDIELIPPVHEYSHSDGCSITGGHVYRGSSLPEWNGVYFFGDYCSGQLWGLLRLPDGSWQNLPLFDTGTNIASFGEDEAGNLYLVAYEGSIYQFVPAGN